MMTIAITAAMILPSPIDHIAALKLLLAAGAIVPSSVLPSVASSVSSSSSSVPRLLSLLVQHDMTVTTLPVINPPMATVFE